MPGSSETPVVLPDGRLYFWVAAYRGGQLVAQFSPDGEERRFGDLEREDLAEVALSPAREGFPVYRQALNPGQRPVWCRRHFLKWPSREHTVLNVIGFQYRGPDGRNYQSLIYVPDDGSAALYGPGPFKEDHAVYGWVPLPPEDEAAEEAKRPESPRVLPFSQMPH